MLWGNIRLHIISLVMLLCLSGQNVWAQVENPFFEPIKDQNLAAIEYLIRLGLDVNQPNDFGLTPLEFAIRAKAVASAQLLHRYGASFDMIDAAVIQEFQRQPGIGPFLEKYANANKTTVNNTTVITQQASPQTQQLQVRQINALPTTMQLLPRTVPIQNVVQQPPVQQLSSQQSFVNQLPAIQSSVQRTISQARNTYPVSSQTNNATAFVPDSTSNLVETIRPQTKIGIANTANTSSSTNGQALETSRVNTQQTTLNNTEQHSAYTQSSNTDVSAETSPTIQETVAVLAAPSSTSAEKQTGQTGHNQQVHFDNPAKVCEIKNPNLVVTFTFDDGEATDLAVIKEIFTPRNVKGTIGIILNRLSIDDKRYMPVSELKRLHNQGWEIASHTNDHNDLTSLKTEDLDYDLLESHKGLQAFGFNVSSLVYPYGANNNLVRSHASKYYYGAFEGGYRLNTKSSNPFKLNRFHIADAHDFPYYKRVTDTYSDQHGWLVWTVHTGLDFNQQQVEDMHKLLDYMCDQGIQVVTARAGLDHLNLVDYQ